MKSLKPAMHEAEVVSSMYVKPDTLMCTLIHPKKKKPHNASLSFLMNVNI